MRIEFKNVVLHNFLSYGHSEINLTDKGYCLVSGINRCPKDNATSNGSGKSSWISAICWCLTGETIQGVSKDIKNIYIDEDECYVELTFNVDKDVYKITRYNKPKSDLKLIINGEDKSGKGIRESELALATYLPDLNKDLLTSVILLGQGLPNKLSSHNPSGRKEMLEKLSKSDFMIEDIKQRICDRLVSLNSSVRSNDDEMLKTNTTLSFYNTQLASLLKEKEELANPNFEEELDVKNEELNSIKVILAEKDKELKMYEDSQTACANELLNTSNIKQDELNTELKSYSEHRDSLAETKVNLQSRIKYLSQEINRLKSIKDICPTCGQKIPGVIIQDTSKQEEELNQLNIDLNTISDSLEKTNNIHLSNVNEINSQYDTTIKELKDKVDYAVLKQKELKQVVSDYKDKSIVIDKEIIKIKTDKDNYNKHCEDLFTKIEECNNNINTLNGKLKEFEENKAVLTEHLDVIKKMDTLVKRDFRGYLLSNVISFIDKKAKEYCADVFGSNELNFNLDGNNIEISYCDKSFESLSGGEKQKVDLLLQFAIRDMMKQYLDFSSNILCLDEIFDNLDASSTNSVLNLIANKLSDVESLFIISHHSDELEIPYDSELIITKNENGVSEVK